MKYAVSAFLVLTCSTTVLPADSWFFPKQLVKEEFKFGESRIVLETDGTADQAFPPYTLSIHKGDLLLAKYRNVGFDKVFASKDNRFFVGVSNSGIPGTAFVVFDAEGNLLREEKHEFLPPDFHTIQSTTLIRAWFDETDPDVEFDIRNNRLDAVFIHGSNGQTYNLLSSDLGFEPPQGQPTGSQQVHPLIAQVTQSIAPTVLAAVLVALAAMILLLDRFRRRRQNIGIPGGD